LCCNRFLKDFASINVRMAKDQDLSLTPSTISGFCGRLKCCLKYEHKGYLELEKTMPRRGDMCDCPEGRGKICDRNLLTQEVTVALQDSGSCIHCACSEVQVVYPDKYKVKPKAAAKEKKAEPNIAKTSNDNIDSSSESNNNKENNRNNDNKESHGRRRKKRRRGKRSKS